MAPKALKAMLAVLPKHVPVLAVGGVDAHNVGEWHATGAKGFGVGSALWKPGLTAAQAADNASAFVEAFRRAVPSVPSVGSVAERLPPPPPALPTPASPASLLVIGMGGTIDKDYPRSTMGPPPRATHMHVHM